MFDGEKKLFNEIKRLMLTLEGLLFEEPEFLLRREVDEVGSYFSIIKSIAEGNRKPGKISTDIRIKQTSLPKYLKTLIDLNVLKREVPVTENYPEKSKMNLYQINDNFLRFWFRFVYPERGRIELGQSGYVLEKIKANLLTTMWHTFTKTYATVNSGGFLSQVICSLINWDVGGTAKRKLT